MSGLKQDMKLLFYASPCMCQPSTVTELVIKSSPVDSALYWGGGQVISPHQAGVKYELTAQVPSTHAVILINHL